LPFQVFSFSNRGFRSIIPKAGGAGWYFGLETPNLRQPYRGGSGSATDPPSPA
jgi:hypothetical protein